MLCFDRSTEPKQGPSFRVTVRHLQNRTSCAFHYPWTPLKHPAACQYSSQAGHLSPSVVSTVQPRPLVAFDLASGHRFPLTLPNQASPAVCIYR